MSLCICRLAKFELSVCLSFVYLSLSYKLRAYSVVLPIMIRFSPLPTISHFSAFLATNLFAEQRQLHSKASAANKAAAVTARLVPASSRTHTNPSILQNRRIHSRPRKSFQAFSWTSLPLRSPGSPPVNQGENGFFSSLLCLDPPRPPSCWGQ